MVKLIKEVNMKENLIVSIEPILQKIYNQIEEISEELENEFTINLDLDFSEYIFKIHTWNDIYEDLKKLHLKTCGNIIKVEVDETEYEFILSQIKICEENYSYLEDYSYDMISSIMEAIAPAMERIKTSFIPIKGESEIEAHSRWWNFIKRLQNIALFLEIISKYTICFERRIDCLDMANEIYSICCQAEYGGKDYSYTFGWYDNYKKYSLDDEACETLSLKQKNNERIKKLIIKEETKYNKDKEKLIDREEKYNELLTKKYWDSHETEFVEIKSKLDELLDKRNTLIKQYDIKIDQLNTKKSELWLEKHDKEMQLYKIKISSFFKFREKKKLKEEIVSIGDKIKALDIEIANERAEKEKNIKSITLEKDKKEEEKKTKKK